MAPTTLILYIEKYEFSLTPVYKAGIGGFEEKITIATPGIVTP